MKHDDRWWAAAKTAGLTAEETRTLCMSPQDFMGALTEYFKLLTEEEKADIREGLKESLLSSLSARRKRNSDLKVSGVLLQ